MTVPVLFATGDVPANTPLSVFGVSAVWTGWDGSVWDLTDYKPHRLALMADGLTGLLWPEFSAQVVSSPAMHGQRLQGVATLPRNVWFQVHIWGRDSADFLDLFTRFTKSWSPLKSGVLAVTAGGHTRTIRLRLAPDVLTTDRDPVWRGRMSLPIAAVADDPFWLSGWSEGDWGGDDDTRDFLSDTAGHLLWISPSQTFATAHLSNPGDEPAWPVWEVTATTDAFAGTITIDDGVIGLPTIPAGKTLVIDTDPARGYADLGYRDGSGVFVFEQEADGILEPYDPRPIPVGQEVPIGFDLTGPGRVQVRMQARHWLGIGNA